MALNGTITLVSNANGGEITKPRVATGTNLQTLIAAEFGLDGVDPEKFQFVVNGTVADMNTKLKDGDFIVISPKAVKGN